MSQWNSCLKWTSPCLAIFPIQSAENTVYWKRVFGICRKLCPAVDSLPGPPENFHQNYNTAFLRSFYKVFITHPGLFASLSL